MKINYEKYIRKYLGCSKEKAKEIAELYEDRGFEELKQKLHISKLLKKQQGLSDKNDKRMYK